MGILARIFIFWAHCTVVQAMKLCHTMYLNADNGLESSIVANLHELVSNYEFVGKVDYDLHVLIDRRTAQSSSAQGAVLQIESQGAVQYRYRAGKLRMEGTTFNGAEVNMDDASTLLTFLKDAWSKCSHAGADTYFLQGSSYGMSWEGFGGDENSARRLGSTGISISQMRMVISEALTKARINKLDMLGFDASLMSSVAVVRAFAPFAKYLLASESSVPGHGWAYNLLTPDHAPWANITGLGINIIDTFVESSHGDRMGHQSPKTLALMETSKYVTLEQTLNSFLGILTSGLMANDGSVSRALGRTTANVVRFVGVGDGRDAQGIPTRSAVDLGDFLAQFSSACSAGSTGLQNALAEVMSAYEAVVVHFKMGFGTAPLSTGMHLWLPTKQAAHDTKVKFWSSYMCSADTEPLPDGNYSKNCQSYYYDAVPAQMGRFMDQWYQKGFNSKLQAEPMCKTQTFKSLTVKGPPIRITTTTTITSTTSNTTMTTSTTNTTTTTSTTTTSTTTTTNATSTSLTTTSTNTTTTRTTTTTTSTSNTTTTTTATTTNTTTTTTTLTKTTTTATSTTATRTTVNITATQTTTTNRTSTTTTTNTTTTSMWTSTTNSTTSTNTTTTVIRNATTTTTTTSVSMTQGTHGCFEYVYRRVSDGAMDVCRDSRLTFQIVVSDDVFFAEGSVHAYIRDADNNFFFTAATHILTPRFNSNLVHTTFDGYFYMVGNTPTTIMQTSAEGSWMIAVDYFPQGVIPNIRKADLINPVQSKSGYLTFTAFQGRLISGLSLMVDIGVDGKWQYSAVLPSEGGMIVPRLYYASDHERARQEAAYKWGVDMNWTISGFSLGSPQALSRFYAAPGEIAVGEMMISVDTELTVDTLCHADIAYIDLTQEYFCPLLNTTTTTTTTSITSTTSSKTSTTTNTTTKITSTTTVTTATTTTTYDWPALSLSRAGLVTLIIGSFSMKVPNPDFFIVDVIAQDAVVAGIALAIGVPRSYVMITVSKGRRLSTTKPGGRRLAGVVKIEYTVRIPSAASVALTKAVAQRAIALPLVELNRFIQEQVLAAKGPSFQVVLTSKTVPVVDYYAEYYPAATDTAGKVKRKSGAHLNAGSWFVSSLCMYFVTSFAPFQA